MKTGLCKTKKVLLQKRAPLQQTISFLEIIQVAHPAISSSS